MNYMQHQPPMYLQTPEEKQMGLFLHLSQLANIILFPVGIILPIVLWQTQKEKMPAIDAHGKMITNWLISGFIYMMVMVVLFVIGMILMVIFVGFFICILAMLGIIAIGLAGLIFSIVGAVKANNGELWEYPLTIKFLK